MPRAALSEDQIDDMRQQICEQAMALYCEAGIEAVSFRGIAAGLQVSHTLPYRYFESKESLFAEMRVGCYARFFDVIKVADPVNEGPVARLHSIARGILGYALSHPQEYRLMFTMEQPPLEQYPRLLAIRQAAFDYLVDIVELAVKAGVVRGDARTIMHLAWGAAHGLMTLHAAGQMVHGRSLDDLIEPMLTTIVAPLVGGVPQS